jgi:hypothetical protein
MVKVVTLFLVVVIVLAMFGKLGWLGRLAPGPMRRSVRRSSKPVTCLHCGKHIIGKSGCDCGGPASKKG